MIKIGLVVVLLVQLITRAQIVEQQQQQQQQQQPEIVFTETVTESRDIHMETATAMEATKTVYMVPTAQRPWWRRRQEGVDGADGADGDCDSSDREAPYMNERETHYIRVTVTGDCPPHTIAPMTVTTAITETQTTTKVLVHWRSVPVVIRYYRTVTETTTARPLIAQLLPRINAAALAGVSVRTTTVTVYPPTDPARNPTLTPTATDSNRYQAPTNGPVNLRINQARIAGELARNLAYQVGPANNQQQRQTITATATVVSTITPKANDWREGGAPATMNECDLCRQRCTDLASGNCCVRECAGAAAPIPLPIMPPMMPMDPDAIPCDD